MAATPPRVPSGMEIAALAQQSREGYFGEADAVTASNAQADTPRIVLDAKFGAPRRQGSLAALDIEEHVADEQLKGCANRYAGKVCVVTGAARGIGAALAQQLCDRGATVLLADCLDDELVETRDRVGAAAAYTCASAWVCVGAGVWAYRSAWVGFENRVRIGICAVGICA